MKLCRLLRNNNLAKKVYNFQTHHIVQTWPLNMKDQNVAEKQNNNINNNSTSSRNNNNKTIFLQGK